MAAQLRVMAELLERGYNVSVPLVDSGDDIYALDEDRQRFFRIQVKRFQGRESLTKKTTRAHITVREDQLAKDLSPELYYVFEVPRVNQIEYVIFKRSALNVLQNENSIGNEYEQQKHTVVRFNVTFNWKDNLVSLTARGKKPVDVTRHYGCAIWDEYWPSKL